MTSIRQLTNKCQGRDDIKLNLYSIDINNNLIGIIAIGIRIAFNKKEV